MNARMIILLCRMNSLAQPRIPPEGQIILVRMMILSNINLVCMDELVQNRMISLVIVIHFLAWTPLLMLHTLALQALLD